MNVNVNVNVNVSLTATVFLVRDLYYVIVASFAFHCMDEFSYNR